MIEINTIPKELYPELLPVFEREFDSDVPSLKYSKLLGAFDGQVLAGFLNLEWLLWFGQICIAPDYRGNGIARKLIHTAESQIPKGAGVITIASEERFERLYRRKGMFNVPGTIWRRDY